MIESITHQVSTLLMTAWDRLSLAVKWLRCVSSQLYKFEFKYGHLRIVSPKDNMISLIIPTYNRAALLERALKSAMNLDYPPTRYEIVIVDNGSTDATPAVVQNVRDNSAEHDVGYVREERLGLHNARHAGVWAAKGDILIFTDDDATFAPGWLRAYAAAFDAHPKMVAAGGPVRASWEVPPPKWLVEFIGEAKTFGILSLMEPYDDFRLNPDGIFFGVNMAIRAHVLLEVGGFNPEAFGDVWLGDGETGLNYKLWNHKMLIGYVPEALVYHHIPRERMTVQYLRFRMANQGVCDLYSDFHRTLPNTRTMLRRVSGLILKNYRSWVAAMLVKNCTDVQSLTVQLESARTQAQLKYMLKVALNKRFQSFVSKKDWINDLRPMEKRPETHHHK
jgi:glucosyl-dolichyl phosphate glucuronosyltransferase